MTFKEKHLLPLMMSAVMITSCGDVKNPFHGDKEKDNMGLLDDRPQKDNDKYGTKVLLYQVNVPVYNADGERLENQYILTRGLQKSSYESASEIKNMRTKPVYLNGSDAVCYVKVDSNNAIYTEQGFCGLFIDYNKKAVVIADENIGKFVSLPKNKGLSKQKSVENKTIRPHSEDKVNSNVTEVVDTLGGKKTKNLNTIDTTGTVGADSVIRKSTYSEEQFLDTLRTLKQKEL